MKHDKNQGIDGLTCNFFSFSWHDYGSFISWAISLLKDIRYFSESIELYVYWYAFKKSGKPKQYLLLDQFAN